MAEELLSAKYTSVRRFFALAASFGYFEII
jgi:hypothetical protein